MLLRTERLEIRYIAESDWPYIRDIWADFSRSEYAQYDTPKSTEDDAVRARIAMWARVNGEEHMFFAVCLDQEVIGFFSFNRRPVGYEVGYGFHSRHHGKGYAKEALIALTEHLAACGVTRFEAGTALNNLPSVRLLRSVGFRRIGTEKVSFYKDGSGNNIFFDGGIFELQLPQKKDRTN